MKKNLWIVSSILLITGCTSIPSKENSNVGIQGLLICEKNEICPIVTVAWNESFKDLLKVKMSLNSAYQQYDIQKVVFTDGSKIYSFNVNGSTQGDYVFGAYRSRNSVMVPKNLLENFSGSQNILMNIYTDHGVISRYILKNNLRAPIYEELSKVYK